MTKEYEQRAKIFQQAMESCKSSSPMDCIEWLADRIVELEAQIEKMKSALITIKNNTDDVNIEWQIKYLFDELEIEEND